MRLDEQLRELARHADQHQRVITAAEVVARAAEQDGLPLEAPANVDADVLVLETEGRPTRPGPMSTRRSASRWFLVAAAAIVVALIGTVLVTAGNDDGDKEIDTVTSLPTTVTSPPTTSAEPPDSLFDFSSQLEALLAAVPEPIGERFPPGYDYAFNGPCSLTENQSWGADATGGGDGGMARAGLGHLGFATESQASDAAARLVESLDSCTATEWRTQPIAGTTAVLASSPDAVTWIQRTGDTVDVLQVPTNGGPPPASVQVDVAEWIVAYRTWQEQDEPGG